MDRGPKGMTAKVANAGMVAMIGAAAWRNLSAFGGTKSSLRIIFAASAAGWMRPNTVRCPRLSTEFRTTHEAAYWRTASRTSAKTPQP